MRRYYDVSAPIQSGMLTWPGDPHVEVSIVSNMPMVSRIDMGTHTGTHVDAPAHFIAGGTSVERLPLDVLIGPATVADVTAAGPLIEPHHLDGWTQPGGRLLLKTRNHDFMRRAIFDTEYVALSEAAAQRLVDDGVALVGIDGPSIDPYRTDGHPAHHILLGGGVVLLEGLVLVDVPAGTYRLMALPLLIPGADGSPARVVLEPGY